MRMSKPCQIVVLLLAAAAAAGCGSAPEGQHPAAAREQPKKALQRATAWINPKSGSALHGSAVFVNEGGQVSLQVSLESAPPGEHAVHIHQVGDCSAEDGSSAGGHWNPTNENHGQWGHSPFHLGDIGNVLVGPDGRGTLSLSTDRWSMGSGGPNDIVGKSVIVHEKVDDFTSQPTGAAGGRIGCGVIKEG